MGTRTNKPKEIEAIEEVTTNEEGFVEEIKVTEDGFLINPKTGKAETERKERTPNTIYTLKQFKTFIKKAQEQKIATPSEIEVLTRIHKAWVERWIGLEL